MTGYGPVGDVHRARDLAQRLLTDMPERWRHTIGVARRAETAASTVETGSEADTLLAAAWLHDIGYAGVLHDCGFHPLDGARYLAVEGWPSRIVGLVAHHSGAWWVARARGLADGMAGLPLEESPVSDALIYADQTVGPNGRIMSIDERLSDMLRRHGPDSPNACAHQQRAPLLRAAVRRVEQRLATVRRSSSAA